MSNESSAAPSAAPATTPDTSQTQTQETSTQETPAVSTAPANSPVLKEAVKQEAARIKKLKLKVDGKDIEQEVNFDDDEFLTRELQKAHAFNKRSQEFSQLTKDVTSFLDELRKNPRKVLADKNIGVDIKRLAAEIIEEEIENSKKSPQQLEKEKLEAEIKGLKDAQEKERQEFQQREFERLQAQEYERYDIQIDQALQKSDLPKSPYVIKKIADYMLTGLQKGLDISPEDVLPLVKEEVQSDLKEMFRMMPAEAVEAMVGKEMFNTIRKKNVAKAKNPPPPVNASVPDIGKQGKTENTGKGKNKQSFKSFFGV